MRRTFSQIKWAEDRTTGELVQADRAEHRPGKGRYRCPDQVYLPRPGSP